MLIPLKIKSQQRDQCEWKTISNPFSDDEKATEGVLLCELDICKAVMRMKIVPYGEPSVDQLRELDS